MDPFHRPRRRFCGRRCRQLTGQPVEKLRMAGRRAGTAKIVRRGHDPLAEMMHPEPIDQHAGRQRMIGLRQPAGKRQAPAAGLDDLSLIRAGSICDGLIGAGSVSDGRRLPVKGPGGGQDRQRARFDFAARIQVIAAPQEMGLRLAGQIVEGANLREGPALFLLVLDLLIEVLHLRAIVRERFDQSFFQGRAGQLQPRLVLVGQLLLGVVPLEREAGPGRPSRHPAPPRAASASRD